MSRLEIINVNYLKKSGVLISNGVFNRATVSHVLVISADSTTVSTDSFSFDIPCIVIPAHAKSPTKTSPWTAPKYDII